VTPKTWALQSNCGRRCLEPAINFYTSDALNVVAFGLLNNPSRSPNTIQTITTPMLRNWWLRPRDQAKNSDLLSLYGRAWLFAGRDWWEPGARKSSREMGVSRSARIRDLGCGNSSLIASLAHFGFPNALGADPFIPQDIVHSTARVLKCEVVEIEGQFNVVIMHHSLEHIWDQPRPAADLGRLVKTGGRCLTRIPTIYDRRRLPTPTLCSTPR
jgi:SAM-dependent methyltransferase